MEALIALKEPFMVKVVFLSVVLSRRKKRFKRKAAFCLEDGDIVGSCMSYVATQSEAVMEKKRC